MSIAAGLLTMTVHRRGDWCARSFDGARHHRDDFIACGYRRLCALAHIELAFADDIRCALAGRHLHAQQRLSIKLCFGNRRHYWRLDCAQRFDQLNDSLARIADASGLLGHLVAAANVNHAAVAVRHCACIGDHGLKAIRLFGQRRMKRNVRRRSGVARAMQIAAIRWQVELLKGRPHTIELFALEELLQVLEADFAAELHFGGAVADAEALRIRGITDDAVCITTLNGEHAARILDLDAAEQECA